MDILFLDIDDVICTQKAAIYHYGDGDSAPFINEKFDPVAVSLIEAIVLRYKMNVVISSTWRKCSRVLSYNPPKFGPMHDRESFKELLIELEAPVLGSYLLDHAEFWMTPELPSTTYRGKEIEQWFGNYRDSNLDPINKFIIIDDGSDMEPYMDHLIHVDGMEGFGFRNYIEACEYMDES